MNNELEVRLHNFIVNNVVGTCLGTNEVDSMFKEFAISLGFPETTDFINLLEKSLADAEVLLCTQCNWWVNQYEIHFNYSDRCTDCCDEEEE